MILKILNKNEKKEFFKSLKEKFGFNEKLSFCFIESGKKKIRIINSEFDKINLKGLKIENLGLYFAKWDKGKIRLSIEGSQIIGPNSKKNVLEINKKQAEEWMSGNKLIINENLKENEFYILKYKKDFLGSGRFSNNLLINFIPKYRRILSHKL